MNIQKPEYPLMYLKTPAILYLLAHLTIANGDSLPESMQALKPQAPKQGYVFQHPLSDMTCAEIRRNIERWQKQGFSNAAAGLQQEANAEKRCEMGE